ncbi:MAG: alpha/beta hydrolase [Verrucomicrobia bacterium]|nr:alpha/beta hydrolase [Verrucomicrobiota bacterium]
MSQVLTGGQGGVVREERLPSAALGAERMVRVYLPASYHAEPTRRYPVLYVHDGQNAFTTAGRDAAFGWGSWELDRIATELAAAGRLREIIMVAVDATEHRYVEYRGFARQYMPEQLAALKRPPPEPGSNARFEAYSRFLREELKPRVDREYRTLSDPAHTGLIGASLGGIVSVSLAWAHPEVFGQAASLSGSFQIEGRWFIERVLKDHSGPPKPIRLYLDSGVVDYSGGDDNRKQTEAVVAELRRLGWRDGRDLLHFVDETPLDDTALKAAGLREDKWSEARRSQHNEFYWRQRVWRALEFLFPPEAPATAKAGAARPRRGRRSASRAKA